MEARDYQDKAWRAAWRWLLTSLGSPLIVLPPGSGKSWVIALLVICARKFCGRVLIITHRKELITQDAEKIQALLPDEVVGIHSAGLCRRDAENDVVVAGVQSIFRNPERFGKRHLIIVDEAHLINGDNDTSMYSQVLKKFPHARMIGLTASPFRTSTGPISGPGTVFEQVCYEVSISALLEQQFLSPLTVRSTAVEVDSNKLATRGGEYVPSSMQSHHERIISAACNDFISLTADRKSVLVFCSGVPHATQVREELEKQTGDQVGLITADTIPLERSETLRRYAAGELKYLCSVDVLTTGYDAPLTDCCVLLFSTLSPGKLLQVVGRGLRLSPDTGKTDCLILDYGENIKRHGAIDDPQFARGTKSAGTKSKIAARNGRGQICTNCKADIPAGILQCFGCGYKPAIAASHQTQADHTSDPLFRNEPEEWVVQAVDCFRHVKRNAADDAPTTCRVIYDVQRVEDAGSIVETTISEFVCFEHQGFAKQKAEDWWIQRSLHPVPDSVGDALDCINRHMIRTPVRIRTKRDGKYFRVIDATYVDERPAPEAWHEPAVQITEGWDAEADPF